MVVDHMVLDQMVLDQLSLDQTVLHHEIAMVSPQSSAGHMGIPRGTIFG